VRVEARFDVLPALPAPSGIVGAVGIVDRPDPSGAATGVTKVAELRDLLGPGTVVSMPEVVHALSNGAGEAVVVPVVGGAPAGTGLLNADAVACVQLRCRSNGAWGNALKAEVRGIANSGGQIVRATISLLRGGAVVESFADLQIAPGQPDDLFDTINRSSSYVVAVDPGFADAVPKAALYPFNADGQPILVKEKDPGTRTLVRLVPADGASPQGMSVKIDVDGGGRITVQVFQGGLQEEHKRLTMNPDDASYLPYALLRLSRLVRVQPLSSFDAGKGLPAATDVPIDFADGASPTVAAYQTAIDRLADDTRIDLVLASIEPGRSDADARNIHQALVAHAQVMADNGAPRIAFGSVTPTEQGDLALVRDHASSVRNRRMVLVSPAGAEGAVAGLVGRMNPQDSPTFKPVPLFGIAPAAYRESELNRLLGATTNALVVQDRAGRGVVVLKGIDTTGDQVSVTRVADQAIRETKAQAENYIGRLNNDEARVGLREQLIATFTRMERDGALVPSTDGKDPAFLVDVYSTQQDFAQGIVRVDIAVRPVRAIDYVYATIRVKN
jgi:hypothetical protein